MTPWTEADSTTFRAIAPVAVPRRQEMIGALVGAAPFGADAAIRILELGCGDGLLAETLLTRFGQATLTALDGSATMRTDASARLAPFGERAIVAAFDLA